MIILLIAILSTNFVTQGDAVNLTLAQEAFVELEDCMFFDENFESYANLSAGSHRIIASYSCEGAKIIKIKSSAGEETLQLEVKKAENFDKAVANIHREALKLRKEVEELNSRASYLQTLVEVINTINVELYNKVRDYTERNAKLTQELETAKAEIENYSRNVSILQTKILELQDLASGLKKQNEYLELELEKTRSFVSNSSFYIDVFKNIAIITIAFAVGTYLALFRRY
ncbi:MAG: hypothetical protein QXR77_00025 [Archaeoglobaceae archaeon]